MKAISTRKQKPASASSNEYEEGLNQDSAQITALKNEMDQWIKHLRKEIKLIMDEEDDISFELRKQGEEIRFNYENISHLTERIDRLEEAISNLASVVEGLGSQHALSQPLRPLRHKT